jgi:hypothetical protein
VFRRSPTHRDPLGWFALVRGSPFDSGRLSQTSRTCMACRKSGVRIPLAPPDCFPRSETYSVARNRITGWLSAVGPCQSASWFRQVKAVLRVFCDLLRSCSGVTRRPSLTREFPLQIPDGSQTGSPGGQNGFCGPDNRTRVPLRAGQPNGPTAIQKASKPTSAAEGMNHLALKLHDHGRWTDAETGGISGASPSAACNIRW